MGMALTFKGGLLHYDYYLASIHKAKALKKMLQLLSLCSSNGSHEFNSILTHPNTVPFKLQCCKAITECAWFSSY